MNSGGTLPLGRVLTWGRFQHLALFWLLPVGLGAVCGRSLLQAVRGVGLRAARPGARASALSLPGVRLLRHRTKMVSRCATRVDLSLRLPHHLQDPANYAAYAKTFAPIFILNSPHFGTWRNDRMWRCIGPIDRLSPLVCSAARSWSRCVPWTRRMLIVPRPLLPAFPTCMGVRSRRQCSGTRDQRHHAARPLRCRGDGAGQVPGLLGLRRHRPSCRPGRAAAVLHRACAGQDADHGPAACGRCRVLAAVEGSRDR